MRNIKKYLPVLLTGALISMSSYAENGVTAQEIVLGQSAPLTGPAAELGKQFKAGAESYFKGLNSAGGVNGRRIRLVSIDDGYNPEQTAINTKKLLEVDKVFSLFGYVGTPTSNAAIPFAIEAKVPFFGAFTGAESLRKPVNRYVFNVRASYMDETQAIVDFVQPSLKAKIGVVYQNDAYGQAGLAGVRQALAKLNLKPLVETTVERNSVDVAKAVADVLKTKPNFVIIISTYKTSAAVTVDIHRKSPEIGVWNVSFVGGQALSAELGDNGQGIGISQVVPPPVGGFSVIATEHRMAYGAEAVTSTTLEGYIAARAFVEGLKRSGKSPTREGFITALESAGTLNLSGFLLKYSPTDHSGSKFVDLSMISRAGKVIN